MGKAICQNSGSSTKVLLWRYFKFYLNEVLSLKVELNYGFVCLWRSVYCTKFDGQQQQLVD